MAEAFTTATNTSILQSLGFQGEAGDGRGDAYLKANPQLITAYETMRKKYEPGYTGNYLRETATPTVQQYTANQVQQPILPSGTEFTPTLHQVQSNELMTEDGKLLDPTTGQVSGVTQITAPTIQATTAAQNAGVNQAQVLAGVSPDAATYDATKTTDIGAAEAAQGQVSELSTVKGQLAQLYAEVDSGVPTWAQGAVKAANEIMAARNMGASSIGAFAVTEAIQQSAYNIAAQDAATYFNMDMANLNNRQAASLETFRARQQNMLTDTAADNASKQFNATSRAQTQQFVAGLINNIQQYNSSLSTNIEQFNASEKNKIAAQNANNTFAADNFNAQMEYNVKSFNSQMQNQRETFNKQMSFAIEQSNVLWRREVNTGNTAAVNAANQANVQNAFNMSMTAQNQLWQQWRDEASWAFSASQQQSSQNFQLALIAGDRSYYEKQQDLDWLDLVGYGLKTLV